MVAAIYQPKAQPHRALSIRGAIRARTGVYEPPVDRAFMPYRRNRPVREGSNHDGGAAPRARGPAIAAFQSLTSDAPSI